MGVVTIFFRFLAKIGEKNRTTEKNMSILGGLLHEIDTSESEFFKLVMEDLA